MNTAVKIGYFALILFITIIMWYPRMGELPKIIRTIFCLLCSVFFLWMYFKIIYSSILILALGFIAFFFWKIDGNILRVSIRYEMEFLRSLGITGDRVALWILVVIQICFIIGIIQSK